jgi:ABC-type nickel/cobalt efflux system permease component RcnA
LVGTAASIGFVHTITGPDHYVPFVAMARAGQWSRARVAAVTALCGLGHVLSSVLLGLAGIGLVSSLDRLVEIEAARGDLAAWGLIAFGLLYLVWGLRHAHRNRRHEHWHTHANGTAHAHDHAHSGTHLHAHPGNGRRMTPWVLFVIFLLGPCEPLIPLLMFPAFEHSAGGVVLVASVFAAVTVLTMIAMVLLLRRGTELLRLGNLERFAHAFAGLAVLMCGLSVKFLGL